MPATRVEQVDIGGRLIRLHKPGRNFDLLVDEALDAPGSRFPWWALLWPASVGLAAHIFEQRPLVGRALELGCGLGLAGLAGAAAGLDVVQTDIEPDALALVSRSAEDNDLRHGEVRLLDWFVPSPEEPYDLVLGADIIYDEEHHLPLLDLLPRLVAPRGHLLLADPCRADADPFLDALRSWFRITTNEVVVRIDAADTRVRIHEAAWPAEGPRRWWERLRWPGG